MVLINRGTSTRRLTSHQRWRNWRRLLIASLAVISLAACQRTQEQAPPTPEVGFTIITPRAVRLADEFNGRVEAVDSVELRPRVSGYLQSVSYREGEAVQKGAVLFMIDQRPYRIALDQAAAQWQRAQAASQLAQLQLERVRKLMQSRATSQEELDNSEGSAVQAKASLHAAAAAVDDAKLNLSFTEVRTPIAGRAGRAELTVGNLARADQTLLTTVVSQDPVYIYFDCDEQSYLRYLAQRGDATRRATPPTPCISRSRTKLVFRMKGRWTFLTTGSIPRPVRFVRVCGSVIRRTPSRERS
ncbi:RND efflux system, membrane fusion protein CmeA [Candidatus Burkholderia humilis]|nr:RND efflux system, membrane fusion protein CmeA [Candidatus Burkholderia humilis]